MSITFKYPLDLTGANPDNLITDEIHSLSTLDIRVIIPSYGAFYSDSVTIKDAITGLPMVYKKDYIIGEISQDITLRTNKEVSTSIIITNTSFIGSVLISYRTVGGMYLNVLPIVTSVRDRLLADTRHIDWVDVLNKPDKMIPTEHAHSLDDFYGFEYLVESLERIRQAIVLSNIPAYEYLLDWIDERLRSLPVASCSDIDRGDPTNKLMTLGTMAYLNDNPTVMRSYFISDLLIERVYTDTLSFTVECSDTEKLIQLRPRITTTRTNDSAVYESTQLHALQTGKYRFSIPIPDVLEPSQTTFKIELITSYGDIIFLCNNEFSAANIPLFYNIEFIDLYTSGKRCFMANPLGRTGRTYYFSKP